MYCSESGTLKRRRERDGRAISDDDGLVDKVTSREAAMAQKPVLRNFLLRFMDSARL
jgi:hypothetical protein